MPAALRGAPLPAGPGLSLYEDMKESIKIELLGNAPLFSALASDKLAELASISRVIQLRKGETLFVVGEPADRLFVIASGTIRAFRVGAAGREQVIHVERTGATLAEVAIFDDGPYPATAAAEEDSVLLALDRIALKQFCFRYPEVAWSALRILAGRLRRHAELIGQLSLQDVVPRLARFLLDEADRFGTNTSEGIRISVELNNQQLASRIGSVREVVSRSLARLEKEGSIALERRQPRTKARTILITNVDALAGHSVRSRE